MIKSVSKKAYAKINLTLEIGNKREDGYHEVATIMHKVDICDEVCVTLRNDNELHVSCTDSVCAERDNLAYKAAECFRREINTDFGCDIHIKKRIPDRAGLAGGSSDAAATIDCLATLLEIHDNELLHRVASAVGSDVPFCLERYICAVAYGRGTELESLMPVKRQFVVVAVPNEGLSTKEIFTLYDKTPIAQGFGEKTQRMKNAIVARSYAQAYAYVYNGFEELCKNRCREIATLLDMFENSGAVAYRMSGSGSAVYALFDDESVAKAVSKRAGALPFVRFSESAKTLE